MIGRVKKWQRVAMIVLALPPLASFVLARYFAVQSVLPAPLPERESLLGELPPPRDLAGLEKAFTFLKSWRLTSQTPAEGSIKSTQWEFHGVVGLDKGRKALIKTPEGYLRPKEGDVLPPDGVIVGILPDVLVVGRGEERQKILLYGTRDGSNKPQSPEKKKSQTPRKG